MEKFEKLSGVAAPFDMINIDTDKILPKQFLKTIKRTGLGANLFTEMRYLENGSEHPEFGSEHTEFRSEHYIKRQHPGFLDSHPERPLVQHYIQSE